MLSFFVPLTFAYAGLIDDLGRSLGLPSYQQVEGEDEASIDMRSRELESQLDICFLAKVIILLAIWGRLCCLCLLHCYFTFLDHFDKKFRQRCKSSSGHKT